MMAKLNRNKQNQNEEKTGRRTTEEGKVKDIYIYKRKIDIDYFIYEEKCLNWETETKLLRN